MRHSLFAFIFVIFFVLNFLGHVSAQSSKSSRALCSLVGCGSNARCIKNVCVCNDGYTGLDPLCLDRNECVEQIFNCTGGTVCKNTIGSYTCECPNGYQMINGTCVDINECLTNCKEDHKVCTNTPGSFSCQCAGGYFSSLLTGNCLNVNECLGNNNCPFFSKCIDTDGSYNCSCLPGFSGPNCDNINECKSILTNNCSLLATCDDTEGGFTCSCRSGYSGDGYSCNNINECEGINECSKNAKCYDTSGSYLCSCNQGFSGDGKTCTDIDECKQLFNPCGLNSVCVNSPGDYSCGCLSGYSRLGVLCVDNDECFMKTDNCSTKANCKNNAGGFSCSCGDGYTGDGYTCTDINECETENKCGTNSACTNTDGGYTCACLPGFYSIGLGCTDVNECILGTHNCTGNRTCVNNIGGFTCDCLGTLDANGQCQHLDQCASVNCSKNQKCVNTILGPICSCKSGFSGSNCEDINECITPILTCGLNTQCNNTEGSYECSCLSGYRRSNGLCIDINECQRDDTCSSDAICVNLPGSYICTCKSGYSGNGTFCEDNDECKSNLCGDNSACTNSPGSFSCACKTGFIGLPPLCLDLNECLLHRDNCTSNQTCTNTIGGFKCDCNSGYRGNGLFCEDINECRENTHNCSANAACINNFGGFSCRCSSGYEGDGYTCKDTDECASSNFCGPNSVCKNFIPGYSCSCAEGYAGYPLCLDVNECLFGKHNCTQGQTCTNTPGSFSCECAQGYEGNGLFCQDINECLRTNDCSPKATCWNNLGGYTCSCKRGYEGNGTTCIDTDECADNPCGLNSQCINTDGSYQCVCPTGFTGFPPLCIDVNECLLRQDNCTANETCVNTNGGYKCDCPTGFEGNGILCLDVNECKTGANNCSSNAVCLNTPGSYACVCNLGYFGNGVDCTGAINCEKNPCGDNALCQENVNGKPISCECKPGFTGIPPLCLDVNECLLGTHNCSANGTCFNTDGGYLCDCPSGYRSNGLLCLDENECLLGTHSCDENAYCFNNIGSYSCMCKLGFEGNGTYCEDVNECADSNCGTNSVCTNILGSFLCSCGQGYTGIAPVCLDVNECLLPTTNNCNSNQSCSNIDGGYTCNCKSGFDLVNELCIDVDECAAGTHSCGSNEMCSNTIGSFKCSCKRGFTGIPPLCIATDMCAVDSDCGQDANCKNGLLGLKVCSCNNGFVGIPPLCKSLSLGITGPTTIGTCTPFTLVATVGIVSILKGAQQSWSVVDDGSAHVKQFNTLLRSNPTSSSAILILSVSDAAVLGAVQQKYEFVYTITDSSNQSSYTSYFVTSTGYPTPSVAILAPATLTIRVSEALTLSAVQYSISLCALSNPVVWKWFINSTLASESIVLRVPALKLSVGTYTVTLAASFGQYPATNSSILLIVEPSPLVVRLSPYGTSSISVEKTLILDSSASYDPEKRSLSYVWSCLMEDGSLCHDVQGASLALGSASIVRIPPNTLIVGAEYSFMLTLLSEDGRIASSNAKVNVLSKNSLSLAIGMKALYTAFTVQLQALTDAPATTTNYFWSSPTLNLSSSSTALSLSPTYPTLAVSYSTLEPGSSHILVLVATTKPAKRATQQAIASAVIVVPTAPAGGFCGSSPSEGYALTTEFTLVCSEWVASASYFSALRYSFSYILDDKEISLGNAQYSSTLPAILPAPKTGNMLTIVARVIGAAPFNAVSTYRFNISVQMPKDQDTKVLLENSLNDTIHQFNSSGDVQSLVQSIISISAVASQTTDGSVDSIQDDLLSLYLSTTSNLDTSNTTKYAASQMTSALSTLMSHVPVIRESSRMHSIVDNILSTLDGYGDLLVGGPVVDLMSSVSSFISSVDTHNSEFASVTPKLRAAIGKIANIAGSNSVCGQNPVTIDTQNVKLQVAKVFVDGDQTATGVEGNLHNLSTSVVFPSNLFSDHLSNPSCVRTHLVTQSPLFYNMMENNTVQSANTVRHISDVQTVTMLHADDGASGEYNIKGLSTPITIVIPISGVDSCNSSIYNCTLECRYFNVSSLEWDTQGCEVVNSSSTSITCACNHLTDFMGTLKSSYAPLVNTGTVIKNAGNIFSNIKNFEPLIEVAVLWAVFIGGMVWAIKHDRRIEKNDLITSVSNLALIKPNSFRARFWERVKVNHSWLCIFYRGCDSSYSTARRISVVFLVIMTSFAANSIFYETRLYPYNSALQKVMTAFWSALIVVPINFFVIFTFKRALLRRTQTTDSPALYYNSNTGGNKTTHYSVNHLNPLSSRELESTYSYNNSERSVSSFSIEMARSSDLERTSSRRWRTSGSSTNSSAAFAEDSNDSSSDSSSQKCKCCKIIPDELPWWMEVIGYILWTGLVLLSTLLILLYGLSFDKHILQSWFLSCWLSVIQDAFLNQPVFTVVSTIIQMGISGKIDVVGWLKQIGIEFN